MNGKTGSPTALTYTSLHTAFEYFNQALFGGSLPPCLITMQRQKDAYGFFSGERFVNAANPDEVTDEIALNPVHFVTRNPAEVLSTLAHEMTHLWQHHFGTPPRKGYHDRAAILILAFCCEVWGGSFPNTIGQNRGNRPHRVG